MYLQYFIASVKLIATLKGFCDQSFLLRKEKLRLLGRGIKMYRTIHDQCKALEIYLDMYA